MHNVNISILSALFVISFVSCTNGDKQHKEPVKKQFSDLNQAPNTCEQSLQALIKSSTLQSPFKKELAAQIVSDKDGEMTIQLTVLSERNRQNTVGWVVLNTKSKSLIDITNDPQNPVKLRYEKATWDRFILCNMEGNQSLAKSTNANQLTDLFPEGSRINFTPDEVKSGDPKHMLFRQKLSSFEIDHPIGTNLKGNILSLLVNNEVFSNSNTFVDSNWLKYFLENYEINRVELNPVIDLAIQQEDYDAVVNLLNYGLIVSTRQLNLAAQIKKRANQLTNYNTKNKGLDEGGDPTFYESRYSRIDDIQKLLVESYEANVIQDRDGFTNLRKEGSVTSPVLRRINSDDHIKVIDNTGQWFLVESVEGSKGYIHHSKIKSLLSTIYP